MLTKAKVTHKLFGEGTVVMVNDNKFILTIQFVSGQKEIGCLPAFQNHLLSFQDEAASAEFEALALSAKSKKEREDAEEAEKIHQRTEKVATMSAMSAKKTSSHSNVVFKCNFCDGGSSLDCIGYNGICSDRQIEHNIFEEKRVWCGAEACLCKQYLDKKIDRNALEASLASGNFICYESSFFRTWSYEAGETVRGINKGKPKTMLGAQSNSLCFLTTQLPGEESKERIIFAAFLIECHDEGDGRSAGKVTAHPDHRIALTLKEARQVRFWDFYQNKNGKAPNLWNTGLFRYLDDRTAVRILKAIADVKEDAAEKASVEKTIDYFCQVNGLDRDKLL